MGAQNQFFCCFRRSDSGKCLYVCAGDEAAFLGGEDHQTPGMCLGNTDQLLVEFLQCFFGQYIGLAVSRIKMQPGNLIFVVFDTEVFVHDATLSISMAPP